MSTSFVALWWYLLQRNRQHTKQLWCFSCLNYLTLRLFSRLMEWFLSRKSSLELGCSFLQILILMDNHFHIVKKDVPVDTIESVWSINQQNCFRLVIVKNMMNRMNSGITTSILTCAYLEWSNCLFHIRFENTSDTFTNQSFHPTNQPKMSGAKSKDLFC